MGGANRTLIKTPACSDTGITESINASTKNRAERKYRMSRTSMFCPARAVRSFPLHTERRPANYQARLAWEWSFDPVKVEHSFYAPHLPSSQQIISSSSHRGDKRPANQGHTCPRRTLMLMPRARAAQPCRGATLVSTGTV